MAAMERESMTVDSTTWKASCFRVTEPGESDSEQNLAQGKSTYSVIERSLECSPLETAESSSPDAAAHVKLSILMAAYNEENTILKAINEVLLGPYPCEIELIVVNDGSTDNTPALLSRVTDPRVIIHHHLSNRGKGASILSAASLATGTHILPFDADLEYAPEDITNLLKPVIKGRSRRRLRSSPFRMQHGIPVLPVCGREQTINANYEYTLQLIC